MLSVNTQKLPRKVAIKVAKAEKIRPSKKDNKKKPNIKFRVIILGGKKKESSSLVEDSNGNPMWDFSCIIKLHRGQTEALSILVEDSDGHHKGQVVIPLVKIGPKPFSHNADQLPTTSSNIICSEMEPTNKCSNPSGYLIYWVWVEEYSTEEDNESRSSFHKSVTSLFGSKAALGSMKSRMSVPVGSIGNIGSVTSLNKPEKYKRSLFGIKTKKDKSKKISQDVKKATPDSSDVDDQLEFENELNMVSPTFPATNALASKPEPVKLGASFTKQSNKSLPLINEDSKPDSNAKINISSTPVYGDNDFPLNSEDRNPFDSSDIPIHLFNVGTEPLRSDNMTKVKEKDNFNLGMEEIFPVDFTAKNIDNTIPLASFNEYDPFVNFMRPLSLDHSERTSEEIFEDLPLNIKKHDSFDESSLSSSTEQISSIENPKIRIASTNVRTSNPFYSASSSMAEPSTNAELIKVGNSSIEMKSYGVFEPNYFGTDFASLTQSPPKTGNISIGRVNDDFIEHKSFDNTFASLTQSPPKTGNISIGRVNNDFIEHKSFDNTFPSLTQSPPKTGNISIGRVNDDFIEHKSFDNTFASLTQSSPKKSSSIAKQNDDYADINSFESKSSSNKYVVHSRNITNKKIHEDVFDQNPFDSTFESVSVSPPKKEVIKNVDLETEKLPKNNVILNIKPYKRSDDTSSSADEMQDNLYLSKSPKYTKSLAPKERYSSNGSMIPTKTVSGSMTKTKENVSILHFVRNEDNPPIVAKTLPSARSRNSIVGNVATATLIKNNTSSRPKEDDTFVLPSASLPLPYIDSPLVTSENRQLDKSENSGPPTLFNKVKAQNISLIEPIETISLHKSANDAIQPKEHDMSVHSSMRTSENHQLDKSDISLPPTLLHKVKGVNVSLKTPIETISSHNKTNDHFQVDLKGYKVGGRTTSTDQCSADSSVFIKEKESEDETITNNEEHIRVETVSLLKSTDHEPIKGNDNENQLLLENIKTLNEEGDFLRKENSELKAQNNRSHHEILELRGELDDVKESLYRLRTRLLEEGAMKFLEKF